MSRLNDLALPYTLPGRAVECLDLGPGWPRTWTVTWKAGKTDNRARLAATTYIWTQVTHGETQFAPCPPEARNDPEHRATWSYDRYAIGQWIRQNKVPFYQQMKPLLDTYATQLSHALDAEYTSGQLKRSLAK
ncbi:hypothetical protein [Streptomyces sp. DSM 118878]